ncbi:MAG: hypothetical protein GX372_01680 [Ignavibacteria bacterium]|jgi:hypothetical protein|nr:hypothetical protein [Ignavibacteria bacterium]
MKLQIILISVLVLCLSACSAGINLTDASKDHPQRVVVLPLKEDNYNCINQLEDIMRNKGYDVYSGELLIGECTVALSKSEEDISLLEFVEYAKKRDISKIIYGEVEYKWQESSYSQVGIMERDKIIEGNYALIDAYCIDVLTGKNEQILKNYRLKKVSLGMPNFIYASPYF